MKINDVFIFLTGRTEIKMADQSKIENDYWSAYSHEGI